MAKTVPIPSSGRVAVGELEKEGRQSGTGSSGGKGSHSKASSHRTHSRSDVTQGLVRFGNYNLILLLGHGGMADVFLAVYSGKVAEGFNKLIVIKRLRESLAEDPEFSQMLIDEARLAARLNHPNVVQTNEIGLVDNQYFIAMEYLDGQPLHRVIARSRVAPDQPASITPGIPFHLALTLLCEVLAGLHHAHELTEYDGSPLRIVHRDVSPHNIFVTYAGQVKLVDFGIAKAAGRASDTQQGVVKGKIAYMAPEQPIGTAIDHRTDVFAVGIVLWELLTGVRMWKGMDDVAVFKALIAKEIPGSPKALNPAIPDEVDRICRRALQPEREDRYATAAEFQNDLERYLRSNNAYASARELGDFVSKLFVDKRTETRTVIDARLAELRTHGSVSAMRTDDVSRPSDPSPDPDKPTQVTSEILVNPFQQKSRRPRNLIIALGMLAIGVVGVMVVRPGLLSREVPVTGTASPTPSPSLVAPTPSFVNLNVRATPPEAKLFLDGVPLASNPLTQSFPRDGAAHTLGAEAPGFTSANRIVTFDGPLQSVELALVKPTTSTAPAVANPTAKRPAVAPAHPQPAATPRSQPEAAQPAIAQPEETPPPQPAPTPTPKKPGNAPPPLDTASPWSNVGKPTLEKEPWRK
jgi:serine/threonine protein kinase